MIIALLAALVLVGYVLALVVSHLAGPQIDKLVGRKGAV